MNQYIWDEIRRLTEECSLPQKQVMEIKETLFVNPKRESVGFRDIAWILKDKIAKQSYPAATFLFVPEIYDYNLNISLATLLIRLIELEQPCDPNEGSKDFFMSKAQEFVDLNEDIFSGPAIAVFILEAGSVFFRDELKNKQKKKSRAFPWLKQIFKKADFYNSMPFYYRGAVTSKSLQTDIFFLRLFLLYRFLDPDPANKGLYNTRNNIKNTVIADILTEYFPLNDGSAAESLNNQPKNSREKADYQEILAVFREYSVFLPRRDIDNLLVILSERISKKTIHTLGTALDILVRQREKSQTQINCLRMRYIDAALLLSLCRELNKTSYFEISTPLGSKGKTAFITKNHHRLIMLRANADKITVDFRSRNVLERKKIEYTGDWCDQEINRATIMLEEQMYTHPEGSTFLFSFIYLKNYRTINEKAVSFDHRYGFEKTSMKEDASEKEKSIIKIKKESPLLSSPYFYGRHIYSLTCLVGRNGSGKSSVVDFLRENFLTIKYEVDEGKRNCENGVLEMKEEDNPLQKFFVIFRVGGKDWYLTNFSEDEFACSELKGLYPYRPAAGITFPEEDCTFAYFSQFHYPTGMYAAQHIGEAAEFRKIISRHVRDLSEENIDRRGIPLDVRSLELANRFNENLVHQIVFLMSEREELALTQWDNFSSAYERVHSDHLKIIIDDKELLWVPIGKYLSDSAAEQDHSEITVKDQDLIEIINNEPNAFIGPFSSGQHSRFKLLSRLFWCLVGSSKISAQYKKKYPAFCELIRNYEDGCSTRLANEDTGVLFFDEGDLCYHPEWQRSFLSDITGMVSSLREKDVQIIVTTNSPFMLSDILREDVFSMHGSEIDTDGLDPALPTYGQNIHMLLAHRFFMENTMGKMSEDTLKWLFDLFARYHVNKNKKKMLEEVESRYEDYFSKFSQVKQTNGRNGCDPERVREFLLALINQVGERIYRVALKNEYEHFFTDK
jgi:predicted ATPase